MAELCDITEGFLKKGVASCFGCLVALRWHLVLLALRSILCAKARSDTPEAESVRRKEQRMEKRHAGWA